VGAMRPQRKLVPTAMVLYGISAEGVLKLLPVGERRAVHLGARRLDPPEGVASPSVMSVQTRVALGEWEMATMELSRLRRHAEGAGEKEEAMGSGGACEEPRDYEGTRGGTCR
jgi:hypothetical protein